MAINRNQALGTSFKLDIPGLEAFNYFVQETEIPSISMAGVSVPYQSYQTNVPSNRLEFDELPVQFLIDEEYGNWTALYNQMLDISSNDDIYPNQIKDIILHNVNSTKTRKFSFTFKGAYPVYMGSVQLSNSVSDVPSLTCSVRFRYQLISITGTDGQIVPSMSK